MTLKERLAALRDSPLAGGAGTIRQAANDALARIEELEEVERLCYEYLDDHGFVRWDDEDLASHIANVMASYSAAGHRRRQAETEVARLKDALTRIADTNGPHAARSIAHEVLKVDATGKVNAQGEGG